jgi:hypothetical protein
MNKRTTHRWEGNEDNDHDDKLFLFPLLSFHFPLAFSLHLSLWLLTSLRAYFYYGGTHPLLLLLPLTFRSFLTPFYFHSSSLHLVLTF